MSSRGSPYRPVRSPHLRVLPTTAVGKWAAGLAAASFVLQLGWRLMGPLGAFPSLVLAVAGGVTALVAITRHGERAVTVYVAVVLLLNAVVFVLGSLLIGD